MLNGHLLVGGQRVLVCEPLVTGSSFGLRACLGQRFRSVLPRTIDCEISVSAQSRYVHDTGTNGTSLIPFRTPMSYPFKPSISLNFVLKYREIQYKNEGIMKALNGDRGAQAYQPVG